MFGGVVKTNKVIKSKDFIMGNKFIVFELKVNSFNNNKISKYSSSKTKLLLEYLIFNNFY